MKKEVLIAIIIGFGLGLVITFGIWTANKNMKNPAPIETPTPVPEETPIPTPLPEFSLKVNSPENNSVSDQGQIEVSGLTAPGAVVVLLYQEGEKILETDPQGQFAAEIALAEGANEIKVSAYDQEGHEASKTLSIVYSTAKI